MAGNWSSAIAEHAERQEAEQANSKLALSDLKHFVDIAHEALTAVGGVNWAETTAQVEAIATRARNIAQWTANLESQAGRKLNERLAIVNGLAMESMEKAMDDAIITIDRVMRQRTQLLARYREAQAEMEAIKAELQLSGQIDGKNAEIRAAQVAKALGENPTTYRVEDFKRQLDELEATLEVERMRYSSAKARLAAATATLQFLAG